MLQNCHLMTSWVPKLERLLEVVQENAHDSFRCFVSAEPPGMQGMKNMPESLLQSCVKVANEAPADIKSNLTRAWANFSQDRIDASSKSSEFKACLFSLCWFHSIVLGRRRFGSQGWSRKCVSRSRDLRHVVTGTHSTSVIWSSARRCSFHTSTATQTFRGTIFAISSARSCTAVTCVLRPRPFPT